MDLQIDLLKLNIVTALEQQHRIQPIALRAATILAERIEQHLAAGAAPRAIDAMVAPALTVDMNRTSDNDAADSIADALFTALLLKLET